MKGWTGKDYGCYIGSIVLSYALVRGIAMLCGMMMVAVSTLLSMAAFVLLPCLCAIFVSYRLKKREKGIWLTIAVPAALDLACILLSLNLSATRKLVSFITGYNNIEAIGFSLLFAILFCTGLLLGSCLGSVLAPRKQ